MKKNIVKYQNDFNKISIQNIGFTDGEMKMLMYMTMQASEMHNDEIYISFQDLKSATGLSASKYSKDEFRKVLKSFFDKLEKFRFVQNGDKEDEVWTVFYGYNTNYEKEIVSYFVSPKAVYLFNEISSQYTRFEYEELLKLSSVPGKQIYKFLKQWKSIGKAVLSVEEMRHLIDCSEDIPTAQVTRKVKRGVEDIRKNIPEVYYDLTYKTRKNKHSVIAYDFTFKRDSSLIKELESSVNNIETLSVNFDKVVFENKLKYFGDIYFNSLEYYDRICKSIELIKESEIIDKLNNLNEAQCHDLLNEISFIIERKEFNGQRINEVYLSKAIQDYLKKLR